MAFGLGLGLAFGVHRETVGASLVAILSRRYVVFGNVLDIQGRDWISRGGMLLLFNCLLLLWKSARIVSLVMTPWLL